MWMELYPAIDKVIEIFDENRFDKISVRRPKVR